MQALLWIAWEFSAKTTESATQKLTLQQWQVVRHGPPKTQNWAYSGLENKWTAKLEQKYLWSYSGGNLWIFIVWKFRCTKYAQIVWVNRSVHTTWRVSEPAWWSGLVRRWSCTTFCLHSLATGIGAWRTDGSSGWMCHCQSLKPHNTKKPFDKGSSGWMYHCQSLKQYNTKKLFDNGRSETLSISETTQHKEAVWQRQ